MSADRWADWDAAYPNTPPFGHELRRAAKHWIRLHSLPDRELKLIASDELASLTIFSPELGSALCPYDGGMDVFVKCADLLLSVRSLFPHWLSTHPDGL